MAVSASEQGVVDEVDLGTLFSLVPVEVTPGCRHCNGLPVVEVQCEKGVVGRLRAEYPWYLDIPDDIEAHPDTPHYEVEWVPTDIHGSPVSFLGESPPPTTLYFNAVEMMRLARKGLIPIEAKANGRKKG